MKTNNLINTPVGKLIIKAAKDHNFPLNDVWNLHPYDWGTIITSRHERVQTHACTLAVLVKVSPVEYRYILFFPHLREPRVIQATGYPKYGISATKEQYNIQRTERFTFNKT